MKNRQKWLIITAITVIFGLVVSACDNGTDPDPCANGHTAGATETCGTPQTCTSCGAVLQAATGQHTVSSWSFKTAANCITSEIEKGTCTVCGGEDTRYSSTNKALGHTLNPLTKVSVSFGVFEDFCTRCEETHKHEFTYKIGDTGPAGGIIFYVADGEDGRPDGITVQGYGSSGDNGYFAEYTAYYLEAATDQVTNIEWSSTFDVVTGATGTAIGTGKANTAAIIAVHSGDTSSNNAAKATVSYTGGFKNDWFLPSREELNQIYIQRSHVGITTGFFWSSSHHNLGYAWGQSFSSGNQLVDGKHYTMFVRAIRAF